MVMPRRDIGLVVVAIFIQEPKYRKRRCKQRLILIRRFDTKKYDVYVANGNLGG
jgi:hypothetical protein